MADINRSGLNPSLNRRNFGEEIVASRSFLHLSRTQLADAANLSHDTISRAEKGDESVAVIALAAIQRALEVNYQIEFPHGTAESFIRVRNVPINQCAVCADPSMPSMTRFIEPVSSDDLAYRIHPLGERRFKLNDREVYRITLHRTHDGYQAAAYVGDTQVTVTHSVSRYVDLGFAEKFGDTYVAQLIGCVEDDIKNRRVSFWAKVDVGDLLEAVEDIFDIPGGRKLITKGKQYKVVEVIPGRSFVIMNDSDLRFIVDDVKENFFLKFHPVAKKP